MSVFGGQEFCYDDRGFGSGQVLDRASRPQAVTTAKIPGMTQALPRFSMRCDLWMGPGSSSRFCSDAKDEDHLLVNPR